MMRTFLRRGSLVFALLVLITFSVRGQRGTPNGEWRVWGADGGTSRYAPLDQINRDNVKNLRVAWTWKGDEATGPAEPRSETTPLMAGGRLFFTAGARRAVVSADAATGQTLWVWQNTEGERNDKAPRRGSGRGVGYWTDGRDERIFTVTPGFRLVSLDAKTGMQIPGFGDAGVVDLFKELDPTIDLTGTIGNTSPPVVSHDTIVIGPALAAGARPPSPSNTKGSIMAFDVRTGKQKWTYRTIPRTGEDGYESWLNGSAEYTGNAGVWTPFSVDEELGYVYLPVEAATGEYYGGHRPGNNLFSSTLVCVDIRSGKRLWYYQLVHHDVWDYDIVSPPILMDVRVGGNPVKVVVQLTKQSYAYVFDRVTGKPIWAIEEKPVPQDGVKGEWLSPTQPIPARPPAFDRVGITTDDLIDFTPELRKQAEDVIKPYRVGPVYMPASLLAGEDGKHGTIILPGNRGGSNWNAGAVDPETGFLYVPSITRPTLLQLLKAPESTMDLVATALAPPMPTVEGLPFIKPPYGRITAYDMNKGEIVWQVANGDTPPVIKNHPRLAGLQIPRTGSPSHAGLLATKTLLFEGEGDGGQPMFRAIDKRTGSTIWETEIAAGPQTGLPMTYMNRGKQYIVFSAGGGAPGRTAQLVAYALPD